MKLSITIFNAQDSKWLWQEINTSVVNYSRTKRKIRWNQIITKLSTILISPCFHSPFKCNEFFYLKKINPLNDWTQGTNLFVHFMYISIDQHVLIVLLLSFIIALVVSDFFLDGKMLSKFNLKTMILIYIKKVMKWIIQICQISNFIFSKSSNFYCKFQLHVGKNIELSLNYIFFISCL